MAAQRLRARYPGTCARCDTPVVAGSEAWWDRETRQLTCGACEQAGRSSFAGGSAQRQSEIRSARREADIRKAHPIVGGAILAITEEPQAITAWAQGAAGERRVGSILDGLAGDGVLAIHDRRIPGRQANIDHLAVSPSGVWVIDAKQYRGRVEKRDVGSWFRVDERLYVAGRDRTKLVNAMASQVAAVERALGPTPVSVPIYPVLCFVGADWPWLARPFAIGGITVTWPRSMADLVRRAGQLTPSDRQAVHHRLIAGLPPAL